MSAAHTVGVVRECAPMAGAALGVRERGRASLCVITTAGRTVVGAVRTKDGQSFVMTGGLAGENARDGQSGVVELYAPDS